MTHRLFKKLCLAHIVWSGGHRSGENTARFLRTAHGTKLCVKTSHLDIGFSSANGCSRPRSMEYKSPAWLSKAFARELESIITTFAAVLNGFCPLYCSERCSERLGTSPVRCGDSFSFTETSTQISIWNCQRASREKGTSAVCDDPSMA